VPRALGGFRWLTRLGLSPLLVGKPAKRRPRSKSLLCVVTLLWKTPGGWVS
jgi:hypothetical protein